MKSGFTFLGKSALFVLGLSGWHAAHATEVIWANESGHAYPYLEEFDLSTGALIQQFLAPNLEARGLAGDDAGRGIEVLGNIIYYTSSASGKVFMTDATTHQDLGYAFDTGFHGIQSLSWDGEAFWLQGSFDAYRYSLDGVVLDHVANFQSSGTPVDPYFSELLNRRDYDGSIYYQGYLYQNKIGVFQNNGTLIRDITLPPVADPWFPRYVTDLSLINPAPVPEPSSVAMMAGGLAMLGGLAVRRKLPLLRRS
ncbi:MAG: motif putative anchor domain protein [Fibrobacteres bacterium]|nr:motif putative anchor domain protein [Fibrobacterota bacterium]